jgi:hypothetical protein
MLTALLLAAAHPGTLPSTGPMCGTRWSRHILADEPEHRTLRGDPWVRLYIARGESLKDARIHRADDVVNGCDPEPRPARYHPTRRRG